jgi:phosphoglucomutase
MTAEMALYYHEKGMTLLDRLDEIYRRYGYFQEMLISAYFKGEKGLDIMDGLMQRLRKAPPDAFGGEKVVAVKDYLDGTVGAPHAPLREKRIDLPSSNVLQFILSDTSIVTARPSGTEPKIKFYASCCNEPRHDLEQSKDSVGRKIAAIQNQLNELINER